MMMDGHNSCNDQYGEILFNGEHIRRVLPAVVGNRNSDRSDELVGAKQTGSRRHTDVAPVILEDVSFGGDAYGGEERLANVGNGRVSHRVGDQQQDDGRDGAMSRHNIMVDSVDNGDGGSASAEEGSSVGDDDGDWASVEAAERKGYSGAAVEPTAIAEGVDGLSVLEVNGVVSASARGVWHYYTVDMLCACF